MDVILQGLLGKKKEKSFWSLSDSELLWNDYWFTVSVDLRTDQYQLAYGNTKGDKPKFSMSMSKVEDIFIVDDDEYTFEISVKKQKKKLHLRCISHDEFETWINVLTRCVDGLPPAAPSAATTPAPTPPVTATPRTSTSTAGPTVTPSGSSQASLSAAEKTEARLKKELAKAKEKAEKVAAMRDAQKVSSQPLPPVNKVKPSSLDSRVEKELVAAAKAKAEKADAGRKSETTTEPAAKQEVSPEALAKLKARAEREIFEARKRAAERIAKQQALEAEAKRKKEVEVQELSPAALEQREQELLLARKKAEERARKQKEKADAEKRASELKPVVIDPETEARLQAQREHELEEARKKAEARANAKTAERKSTSGRSPSPASRKASTKLSQPPRLRPLNEAERQEDSESRPSVSGLEASTPRGSEDITPVPSPRARPSEPSDGKKAKSSSVVCDLCDEAPAVVSCQECGLKLCFDNGCDEDIHKGGKSRHERVEIEMKTASFSKMVVCYLCGQQFTHLSLQIHYDSCRIKRKLLYKNLPEHLRPRFPAAPTTPLPNDNSSKQDFKQFNDECTALARECMVLCPNEGCGRRFEPDRVEVHLRGCRFRERSRME